MTAKRIRELIHVTHEHGIRIKREIAQKTKVSKALERLNAERRRALREQEAHAVTMYDSVEVAQIPSTAEAAAGYVGGDFPTFHDLQLRFPKRKLVSMAVNTSEEADVLDVENGDATPEEAPAWCRRRKARGARPKLYANLSTMPAVKACLKAAGIPLADVDLWVAHYDGLAVIPAGYAAKQYTDNALRRNLDASVVMPSFFP